MSTTISTGLDTSGQFPLDSKLQFKTLVELQDLGTNDTSPYEYYEDMLVWCVENHTQYIWRERINTDDLTDGVLTSDFTYLTGAVADGIDYGDRDFNFFVFSSDQDVSASNGLDVDSLTGDVKLGGDLTESTEIKSNISNYFYIANEDQYDRDINWLYQDSNGINLVNYERDPIDTTSLDTINESTVHVGKSGVINIRTERDDGVEDKLARVDLNPDFVRINTQDTISGTESNFYYYDDLYYLDVVKTNVGGDFIIDPDGGSSSGNIAGSVLTVKKQSTSSSINVGSFLDVSRSNTTDTTAESYGSISRVINNSTFLNTGIIGSNPVARHASSGDLEFAYGMLSTAEYVGSGNVDFIISNSQRANVTGTGTGTIDFVRGTSTQVNIDNPNIVVNNAQGAHPSVNLANGTVGDTQVMLLDYDYDNTGNITVTGDLAYLRIQSDPLPPISGSANAIRSYSSLPSVFDGIIETDVSISDIDNASDKVVITKEWFNANNAGGGTSPTGLERISSGFRLIGKDPLNYGTIGLEAVDLSHQASTGTNGATGDYSLSGGRSSSASGSDSVAFSFGNASGDSSFAMGGNATGEQSFAFGGSNATGDFSISFDGSSTGDRTFTTPFATARSYREVSVGGYQVDYTPISTTSWDVSDRLFIIGNGVDNNNRSDALVVLKDGSITAPSFEISQITDPKSLVTKEFFDANSSSVGDSRFYKYKVTYDETNNPILPFDTDLLIEAAPTGKFIKVVDVKVTYTTNEGRIINASNSTASLIGYQSLAITFQLDHSGVTPPYTGAASPTSSPEVSEIQNFKGTVTGYGLDTRGVEIEGNGIYFTGTLDPIGFNSNPVTQYTVDIEIDYTIDDVI